MARFRYYVAASVDGYIADAQDSLDWLMAFDDFEGNQDVMADFLASIGSLVMGAGTYRWLLENMGGGWPYAGLPTWVLTHRELPAFPGADITFIRGDIAEWVGDIADDAGQKDVWVMGGGQLAGQFVEGGYLDELILFTIPVVLGGGRPLFAMGSTASLVPTTGVEHGMGVRETRYDVVAPPAAAAAPAAGAPAATAPQHPAPREP
jgi:dihydrofolate reductase